ncbi:MAG: hypothetical protein MUP47_03760 [Phycisphaerae bacterium]|nr:hypothetical protein [Phycisphaerae bacterium]
MNIIVTTPKTQIPAAAAEARDCILAGGGRYFRRFPSRHAPGKLNIGDRVYYVEDGFVRGYALICELRWSDGGEICQTTGRRWPPGYYVFLDVRTWKWIAPIPLRGFQGFKYVTRDFDRQVRIIGDWLAPKPATPALVGARESA